MKNQNNKSVDQMNSKRRQLNVHRLQQNVQDHQIGSDIISNPMDRTGFSGMQSKTSFTKTKKSVQLQNNIMQIEGNLTEFKDRQREED